jgi:hypothetical protein
VIGDIDLRLGVGAGGAAEAVGVAGQEVLERRAAAADAEGEIALRLVGRVLVLLLERRQAARP